MPGLRAGFLHFGVATLCLIFQPWDSMGRHGTKWDEHRSRGRGRAKIARIAMSAKIADIEKQGLAADLRW